MLTNLLTWLCQPIDQRRCRTIEKRIREMENRRLFVLLMSDRRKPDILCEDDGCVERIRLNDGPMEG